MNELNKTYYPLSSSMNCSFKRYSSKHNYSSSHSSFILTNGNLFELNDVESATSSSILHGFILISIILLSLIGFIVCKLKNACEDYYLIKINFQCYEHAQWTFIACLILSCLYAFIIYFLHLIGQCDYVNWIAKRKVLIEIVFTFLISILLICSNLVYLRSTVAIFSWICISSSICGFIVFLFYLIRIYLLYREYRMLNDKPTCFKCKRSSCTSCKTMDSLILQDKHDLSMNTNKNFVQRSSRFNSIQLNENTSNNINNMNTNHNNSTNNKCKSSSNQFLINLKSSTKVPEGSIQNQDYLFRLNLNDYKIEDDVFV